MITNETQIIYRLSTKHRLSTIFYRHLLVC